MKELNQLAANILTAVNSNHGYLGAPQILRVINVLEETRQIAIGGRQNHPKSGSMYAKSQVGGAIGTIIKACNAYQSARITGPAPYQRHEQGVRAINSALAVLFKSDEYKKAAAKKESIIGESLRDALKTIKESLTEDENADATARGQMAGALTTRIPYIQRMIYEMEDQGWSDETMNEVKKQLQYLIELGKKWSV